MQLGISSYTYPWAVGIKNQPLPREPLSLTDLLERAVNLGVAVLQIADNMPLDTLSTSGLAQFSKTVRASGVSCEVGTRGVEPAHLLKYLEICKVLQCPLLRTLLHSPNSLPSIKEAHAAIVHVLPEFRQAGVALAVENHDLYTAGELAQLMKEIDDPLVGICLDTVNNFGALEGPAVVIETLAPYVLNLHVKDFEIKRLDHQLGFSITGTPAGQGRLRVPELLSKLRSLDRNVNVILEQWTPYQADLADTVSLEADWAEQGVKYLKAVIAEAL